MAKTYDKVRYIETSGFNPHYNLAVESALMDAAKDGELIVYLWRNDNTVVIGRHQNAYLDVNIKKLHDAGGFLARRPTGGGAVFHDKGNLNFSFITSLSDYDVNENNDIIIRAVKNSGFLRKSTDETTLSSTGESFRATHISKHRRRRCITVRF